MSFGDHQKGKLECLMSKQVNFGSHVFACFGAWLWYAALIYNLYPGKCVSGRGVPYMLVMEFADQDSLLSLIKSSRKCLGSMDHKLKLQRIAVDIACVSVQLTQICVGLSFPLFSFYIHK